MQHITRTSALALWLRKDHIFLMESAFFNNEVFLNFSQTYLTWFALIFKFSKLKQKNIDVIFFHQNLLG